jgi:flagellar hook-associated protein 2
MASIQLSGLSTGIDTKAMIQQLMQVEMRRLTMLESTLTKKTEKRTAVNELQSKLSTFKSSLNALSDASKLRSFNATSSNTDKLSVSTSSGAHEGSHSVQIKQLATANRWVHDGFKYATSYVGAGTFIFSYNNQERILQTTDQTTLQDLVTMINNDPDNPGVTASILNFDDGTGKPYHLVLNGRQSGSDYQISINSSSTEVRTGASLLQANGANATATSKLSALTDFSGQGLNFLHVDEVAISGSLNDGTAVNTAIAINPYTTVADLIGEIEEAFGGTVKVTLDEGQLKITDKTSGASQMTLSLAFNTDSDSAVLGFNQTTQGGGIAANIASFAPSTFIETQTAQDSLIKVDDYPAGANTWISRSSNTIDDVITGITLNLQGTTANTDGGFDALNVNLTRDTASLKSKMQAMIDAYNTLAMYFDEKTKYNAETKTSGILSNEFGLTSIRSLVRVPFLSNATGFTGSDSFVSPKAIGLTIGSDGMLTLDAEKFDEAVVQNYLGVLSLVGAQKSGSSSGADAAYVKFYNSSKYTQAGAYDVRAVIDAEGTVTSALIKLASESWSQARQAEVSGNYIIGASGSNPRNPEYDLQISIDTRQVGRTLEASINVRQGFAGNLYDIVDKMTDSSTGRVTASKKGVETQISNIEKRIENEQIRLEKVQERLVAKYARLEKMLTMIQQQFSGLSSLSS